MIDDFVSITNSKEMIDKVKRLIIHSLLAFQLIKKCYDEINGR